jgi:hypothetical protein
MTMRFTQLFGLVAATYDALNRLVETNIYDGAGQVTVPASNPTDKVSSDGPDSSGF